MQNLDMICGYARVSTGAQDLTSQLGEHEDVWGVWRQPARWALI
jgi:hypothetical protein